MTTKARKRTKNSGLMKIGVWNVRGLYGIEKLLQEELKRANVDIAVIPETKKKLKGSQELEDYILLYSGDKYLNSPQPRIINKRLVKLTIGKHILKKTKLHSTDFLLVKLSYSQWNGKHQ